MIPHPFTATFSVILCAYTEARWHELVAAVASVEQQTLAALEIIVAVDHNPNLYARVRQEMPQVVAVENQEARGLSGTRNSGVTAARGSHIAFLDDDALAEPHWLASLATIFNSPDVQGAGGSIQPLWAAGRPAWFPKEFDWVVGCTYTGMPEQPQPVRNLIGCNMAFPREIFDQIGGFRIGRVGSLSIGQENDETEFCIRLTTRQPDATLLYDPDATVHHRVPASRGAFRYFARRCFSEGLSKARLAEQVEATRTLSVEQAYTLQTLPKGVVNGVVETLTGRDATGVLRASAIIAGLGITASGYALGKLQQASRPSHSAVHSAH